ncbi:hypothetical protein GUJ93_ZPchr0011g27510 [Zizania palustris]|uniref:ARGOS-like protein n=1 Tax=Zizania palustris TaxID=103762 RepID=A0A8J5WM03_ZIZPA|nr:hypothetical protein GUJ93_ZPchr0011g27510 [Zizania palustris]
MDTTFLVTMLILLSFIHILPHPSICPRQSRRNCGYLVLLLHQRIHPSIHPPKLWISFLVGSVDFGGRSSWFLARGEKGEKALYGQGSNAKFRIEDVISLPPVRRKQMSVIQSQRPTLQNSETSDLIRIFRRRKNKNSGARQRRNHLLVRPNASKRHFQQQQANAADKKVATSNYFSIEAFLVLAFLTMSLLILPLMLPPLPPPPSLLLLLPVCMLILLIVLAFMPTDMRSMASSYL